MQARCGSPRCARPGKALRPPVLLILLHPGTEEPAPRHGAEADSRESAQLAWNWLKPTMRGLCLFELEQVGPRHRSYLPAVSSRLTLHRTPHANGSCSRQYWQRDLCPVTRRPAGPGRDLDKCSSRSSASERARKSVGNRAHSFWDMCGLKAKHELNNQRE